MTTLNHQFPFDPSYGYTLDGLLGILAPPTPADFAGFWLARQEKTRHLDPFPELYQSPLLDPTLRVFELVYRSTDGLRIRGWLLAPWQGPVQRALILGHGYGGIDRPQISPRLPETVYVVPCFRGLGLSQQPPISNNPAWHVLHDIDKRDRYIIGGCVDDLWMAVSSVLQLYPEVSGHVAYLGISFGGGIGTLAMPWETRVARWHLNVPSFGQQPLRLSLPSIGSAASVQKFQQDHRDLDLHDILRYFDAATAATFMTRPVHVAAARFDPAVAPPGQFAIYNALAGIKRLFVLTAGHFDYPNRHHEELALLDELKQFLRPL